MTRSGDDFRCGNKLFLAVLIPLLVDDPLWVSQKKFLYLQHHVLIPLLVDDPLWEYIPVMETLGYLSLNPSFSG